MTDTSKEISNSLTVCFPTWNNLRYLKLFYKALRQNSHCKNIELALHINEGSDGTLEWAKENGIRYNHSETNLDISKPTNSAVDLANTEWVVLLADDIYVLPDWDLWLYKVLKAYKFNDNLWAAPRLIEPINCFAPAEHFYCSIANYGTNIDEFKEDDLLKEYKQYQTPYIKRIPCGNMAIKKSVFQKLCGYDESYIYGADSDFSYKFFKQYGAKGIIQIGNSMAYHFGSIVSGANVEKKQKANQQTIQKFRELHGFFVGDLTNMIVNSK